MEIRRRNALSGHFDKLPIAVDPEHLEPNVTRHMIADRAEQLREADQELRSENCRGCEFTGWLRPNEILAPDELARLRSTAKRLRDETDVLLLIGIGGSYLGARAVIEALADEPDRVVYAGQNISAHYIKRLKSQLEGKNVAINVVSKSGTTTEPAIAFRMMKDLVPSESASRWTVTTTDVEEGALLRLAKKEGYETFAIPDDIGGRYSVLSAVGLLPIAYAGVDVDALISGAATCAALCSDSDPLQNPAYFYAAARKILYDQGFAIELLAPFEARLHVFTSWWKQLFGESEGKEGKALYPASVDLTTDLHSMGQYIQEGRRVMFETFLTIDGGEPALEIPKWENDPDGLNYLAGRNVSYVNCKAHEGTALAHREGGVPNMTILLERLDAYSMGALIYFFEVACAVSALMLDVNPFDQPGVEAYKKHMFELLGKSGYLKPQAAASEPDYVSF